MYVYAWHALCGYWGGVSPESPEMARRYRPERAAVLPGPGILEVEPSWAWDPIAAGGVALVAPQAQGAFFDDLHSYLASAGCDGVKVDVQAIASVLGSQCVHPHPAAPTHSPTRPPTCMHASDRGSGAAAAPAGTASPISLPSLDRHAAAREGLAAAAAAAGCGRLTRPPGALRRIALLCVCRRGGGSEVARAIHDELEKSVELHFPLGSCINCMCHTTDNIFHFGARSALLLIPPCFACPSPCPSVASRLASSLVCGPSAFFRRRSFRFFSFRSLPPAHFTAGTTAIARMSDDFYPKGAASWTAHIVNVAYNTLFLGEARSAALVPPRSRSIPIFPPVCLYFADS